MHQGHEKIWCRGRRCKNRCQGHGYECESPGRPGCFQEVAQGQDGAARPGLHPAHECSVWERTISATAFLQFKWIPAATADWTDMAKETLALEGWGSSDLFKKQRASFQRILEHWTANVTTTLYSSQRPHFEPSRRWVFCRVDLNKHVRTSRVKVRK